MKTLFRNATLATITGGSPWGLISNGALICDGPTLAWVGATADLPKQIKVDADHDLGNALVTPGLIDCHTHLVYGGQRAREFELRLNGASYEEIAKAGGGIIPRSLRLVPAAISSCSLRLALVHERFCAKVSPRLKSNQDMD